MYFQHLRLRSVRSHQSLETSFPSGVSFFIGPNGCGKTTILESIYFLLTLRSFRTNRTEELIHTGEGDASIYGKLIFGDVENDLEVRLLGGRKQLFRNQKTARKSTDYLLPVGVVVLAPEHAWIITGGGEERRRFLDRGIFHMAPSYLQVVQSYEKAVRQKRSLLRRNLSREEYLEEVEVWNHELARYGDEIRSQRRSYAEKLRPHFLREHDHLSAEPETTDVRYRPHEEDLTKSLQENLFTEFYAKRCLVGPHRDDLEIHLRGSPASKTASQGEKSTILLSLKLAEFDLQKSFLQSNPLLLLDDVGATLDRDRRERVFRRLDEEGSQAIVSTADLEVLHSAKAFHGRVSETFIEKNLARNSFARHAAT